MNYQVSLVSRMPSAVEGQAFGELADLAGANVAEKRAVVWSRTFSGKQVRACGATVARSAPVSATTAPRRVLVCETVRAVLVYKNCPQPLLCAQL